MKVYGVCFSCGRSKKVRLHAMFRFDVALLVSNMPRLCKQRALIIKSFFKFFLIPAVQNGYSSGNVTQGSRNSSGELSKNTGQCAG